MLFHLFSFCYSCNVLYWWHCGLYIEVSKHTWVQLCQVELSSTGLIALLIEEVECLKIALWGAEVDDEALQG